MSYTEYNQAQYEHFFDFGGAADETISIKGPKGKAGRLWDYGVYGCIEVMNGASVTPKIAIGTTSNPDAYGEELDLNALADNEATSLRILYDEIADATSFDALLVEPDIPADTEVYMTLTGATSSPTGQATAFCIIRWDL